jgi:transcriptional regulator with XRE-family HTH domain
MDYKKMGGVIKKRRNALKITQEQLAEMINKSTVYISLIESGARHPSLETLYSIALSLKTSVDTIIYDKSSFKNEEHVDEFSFLLADRNEEEISLIMDLVREVLRHLSNGRLTRFRRNGPYSGGSKKRQSGAINSAGAGGSGKHSDGFDEDGDFGAGTGAGPGRPLKNGENGHTTEDGGNNTEDISIKIIDINKNGGDDSKT